MLDEVTPLDPRTALADCALLVTGVTGFLGKVWLAMVLDQLPAIRRIAVIVRGRDGLSAEARFEEIVNTSPVFRPLRERLGSNLSGYLAQRLVIVEGDVAKPLCGLHPRDVSRLRRSVDAVVHFAGLTDFQPDPAKALPINVDGARHAADLAARCARPRFIHISTAYVAGNLGNATVPESIDGRCDALGVPMDVEEELRAVNAAIAEAGSALADKQARIDAAAARATAHGWPNLYTYSKALAERVLVARTDIELTIVRPTVVECARTYPMQGWNEGINTSGPLSWLIATAFRDFPSTPHHHFDIVPVDLVARGVTLIVAAALQDRAGGVFHLGTSDFNPATFERIIELNGLAVRKRIREDSDATAWDRMVLRNLDPIAVDADRRGPLHVSRLRKLSRWGHKQLRNLDARGFLPPAIDEAIGSTVQGFVEDTARDLGRISRELGRVETMLELYRPFTHDNDWVFRTDRVRGLSDALPADAAEAHRWDAETIDWRHYWVEVEVPGLEKWSIPLLRGETPPLDPPMNPPIRLGKASLEDLQARSAK